MKILFPEEGESWNSFIGRLESVTEDMIVIISGTHDHDLVVHEKQCQKCLRVLADKTQDVLLATHNHTLILMAHSRGIEVVEKERQLKKILKGHPKEEEALREFLPHVWRQELRSRLQSMGLLSLPKIRVWFLIIVSVSVFIFVLFRLLPSAEISIKAQDEPIIQTSNIFLVGSGVSLEDIPSKVRTMELVPIVAKVHKTITYDDISKEFLGKSSSFDMKVVNNTNEKYSLRQGTRFTNQAGMIFRIKDAVVLESSGSVIVRAIADDEDLYGDIIGERGNVPEGLRWDIPGLAPEERIYVYGTNVQSGRGGTTSHRLVLHDKDIERSKEILKQELLAEANQLIDEQITLRNAESGNKVLTRLEYDELTKITFTGFVLPTKFLGEKVQSVPVEGGVEYMAYAYDKQYVLELLSDELQTHVENGKKLVEGSAKIDRLVTHVIDYNDELSWIKLTVDLTGNEQPILDPLTPSGAHFAKEVRELVAGKSIEEALKIVNNLQEVEKATISIWPPWTSVLPTIPYHIRLQVLE